jgi:hypothetical protein
MEWFAPLPKRPQKGHDVNAFKRHIEMRQTMKDCKANSEIKVLGIDLAKQSFQLHGVDKAGQTVLRRKLNRNKLTAFIANLPPCLIGANRA